MLSLPSPDDYPIPTSPAPANPRPRLFGRPAHGKPHPPAQLPHEGPAHPSIDPVAPGGTPKTVEPFVGVLPPPPEPFHVRVLGDVHTVTAPNRRAIVMVANMTDANSVVAAPANPKRHRLVLVNASGKAVVLLGQRQDDPGTGFPLPVTPFEVTHQGTVYMACPTATLAAPALVNVYAEVETG